MQGQTQTFNLQDEINTFRILISTDNHVGYKEKHPKWGNDSFAAFEEVLEKAKELKVDFLLLGGYLIVINPKRPVSWGYSISGVPIPHDKTALNVRFRVKWHKIRNE